MLNIDFELFYDPTLTSTDFLATCNFSAGNLTCPHAPTFEEALEYAEVGCLLIFKNAIYIIFCILQSNEEWIITYVEGYDVMTAFVDQSLVTLTTVA